MAGELSGRRVAVLAADGVEQVELVRPREALTEAGARVDLVSLSTDPIQAMNGDIEPADRFAVDREVSKVSVDDYDALVVPGGTINPDHLRTNADAVGFVRDFVNRGGPVAAICHGLDRGLTAFLGEPVADLVTGAGALDEVEPVAA
ncbi:DJ-1/PfpI family protein, partial [Nocardiopsis alba]|uniref:DJ-1/PfpI family protein n=1 Tax=Nocardiopsis alba TaxID=53437 RepID=UPI0033E6825B